MPLSALQSKPLSDLEGKYWESKKALMACPFKNSTHEHGKCFRHSPSWRHNSGDDERGLSVGWTAPKGEDTTPTVSSPSRIASEIARFMTQSKIGCGPVDSVEPMREMLYGNRGDQFKDLQNIPVAENA